MANYGYAIRYPQYLIGSDMDIFAHGLWTNAAYHGASPRVRWWAILFGAAPDIISFGPFFVVRLLTRQVGGIVTPPTYVHALYAFTHSLIVWAVIFIGVAIVSGVGAASWWRPWWPLGGWALHIGLDIFSHDRSFFPTPFLWPLSNVSVSGIPWVNPYFLVINYGLLFLVYAMFWRRRHSI